ncbi:hypothetical protein COU57_00960 [Candidatus Pacearchaeota archaeon CG10_big_fil_rev_8_21_14_0_10_32_14]|nr:MAG: hypothetical protein COU57_00960 [Candidatus Pacearchaeota archaeon CG10_big_fil_rev_8_21_14_0_10_32_14]
MDNKLIAYSQDFASFVIQKIKSADKINQIILYGSVSKGEESNNSDIDLFFDVKDQKIENEILGLQERYYDSVKVKNYWKLFNIKNELHCTIGKLDEWSDLKESIKSHGIVLYGKYNVKTSGEPFVLYSVTHGNVRTKNISLWRKLYGYSQKVGKKNYISKGLVEDCEGEKLARGVFMVPSEYSYTISSYLGKNKIKFVKKHFYIEKQ